jgi:hypothetical protein
MPEAGNRTDAGFSGQAKAFIALPRSPSGTGAAHAGAGRFSVHDLPSRQAP